MERTLISTKELAERWGKSPDTLDRLVRCGVLHPRLKIGPGVYSLAEVERLETEGIENLTPRNYRKQKALIQTLKAENEALKAKINSIIEVLDA